MAMIYYVEYFIFIFFTRWTVSRTKDDLD